MQTDVDRFEALFAPPDKEQSDCVIRAVDVKKIYRMGPIETHALRGATLDIYRSEYVSIMGPSGSGKSTLFNMIGALQKPTSGKVYIDQVDIAQLDYGELAWLRCRKIGYIFQTFNLIQVMTCLENVTLPMAYAGMDGESADEPTANLDQRTGAEMIELLAQLKAELGVTIISATHDLKMLQTSDRILWIEDGRIVKSAQPEEIDFSGDEFH